MVFLVTGANRGLGLEFVRQLAGRGDTVLATARNPEAATELKALAAEHEGRVELFALDIASPESIAAFAEALGDRPVDVLLNNAGVYLRSGGFGSLDHDLIEQTFQINVLGPIRVAEATLQNVLASDRKLIVNVSSQMGSIADNSSGGAYAYRMSKAALNMATRSMSLDLQAQGAIVLTVHPGWVLTDMGGPNALITPERSISGLLSLIDTATPDHSGHFHSWDGSELPW